MTSVDEFFTERTLLELAAPNDFIDGAAAAEHGSVRILEHDDQHLRASVEDTQIYESEFRLDGEKLAWSCSCGKAAERPCRHLVATALTTWPDEPPDLDAE